MKFDTYLPAAPPTLPPVDLSDGETFSSETLGLDENSFSEHMNDDYIGGIMPGDILVTITKNAGDYGGVSLEHVEAAIQNMKISVPIDRQDIYGFGSNYVFNRKAKYPIIGSLTTDMIIREFATGETQSFFTEGTRYDILIENRKRYADGSSDSICTFQIDSAQLKSQNFNKAIGDNASVSSTFSFGIGVSGGLRLYRA
jgi:hypothetical protein